MQRPRARRPKPARVVILVGTRKGAWIFHGDAARAAGASTARTSSGHIVNHVVLDPRDGRTLLMAAKTGHLGPTVFRSHRPRRTWKEASRPPLPQGRPRARHGARGRSRLLALTPGHAGEPGVWYAGTSPKGCSAARTAATPGRACAGFNDHPHAVRPGCGERRTARRTARVLHSILIDPRDPAHMYFGDVGRRLFREHRRGARLEAAEPGRRGRLHARSPYPEYGQDPHCMRLHPLRARRLYQQNHCGIYRIERPRNAGRASATTCRARVGDIGFPIVLHPRDPDTAWVFPMDGTDGVAAHQPRRQAGGLRDPRRRQAPGSGRTAVCRASRRWFTV